MSRSLSSSEFLADLFDDWRNSEAFFPKNLHPAVQWPIPFFGNPAKAVVATVGVNPSSGEFASAREWDEVKTVADWKWRLRDYFKHEVPPHPWFNAWSAGLQTFGLSYKDGTATHLDVSYRSTTAMLKNKQTNPEEFRRMVERDVQWFFRLLPLCPELRVLLTFGPMVRSDGTCESLLDFLAQAAPAHKFTFRHKDQLPIFRHNRTGRCFRALDVSIPRATTIASTVLTNLRTKRSLIESVLERRFEDEPALLFSQVNFSTPI